MRASYVAQGPRKIVVDQDTEEIAYVIEEYDTLGPDIIGG
jgi:hypothetical protein